MEFSIDDGQKFLIIIRQRKKEREREKSTKEQRNIFIKRNTRSRKRID